MNISPLLKSSTMRWQLSDCCTSDKKQSVLCSALVKKLTALNLKDSDYRLKAAGTLLYAINPQNHKGYVLLSKEGKRVDGSSKKWAGFGGGRDLNETLLETAQRETFEESRGMIKIDLALQSLGIVLCKDIENKFGLFLAPIEFNENLPKQFLADTRNLEEAWSEKVDMRWISLDSILTAIYAEKEYVVEDSNSFEELPLTPKFAHTVQIIHQTAPSLLSRICSGCKAFPSGTIECFTHASPTDCIVE